MESLGLGFTAPGQRRFVQWVTGLALNVEEHTITQSLIAVDRADDWKTLESFAEYGRWSLPAIHHAMASSLASLPCSLWFGYHVWAGDDTKVHRTSADVWGSCTFHEYSARSPNRASTVRAHNWVVTGALLPQEEQPALFLPVAALLYCRQSQLPPAQTGPPFIFKTKCQLLVEQLRRHAISCPGNNLGVFDGAFAVRSVVRPLIFTEESHIPVIHFVTRLRLDARLHLPVQPQTTRSRGRPRKWGKRLSPPRQGGRWPGKWQHGEAFLYGRRRKVRYKEVICQWRVLGHDYLVKAVVAEVEGYGERFTLVCSDTNLTGLQIVELFCARFRQEDGFRDLKQRLGWEECRAWTRLPIERTTQAVLVSLTAMKLLALQLQAETGDGWWLHPPWNKSKSRPSVLDVARLLRQHQKDFQQGLAEYLGSCEKIEG